MADLEGKTSKNGGYSRDIFLESSSEILSGDSEML